jgi:hypothetical protein
MSLITHKTHSILCVIQPFLFHGVTAPSESGPLIAQGSRSHSDTPQCVGLLWTNDQLPVLETG